MLDDQPDYKRFLLAIFLAALVLNAWEGLVEWPRRQHLAHFAIEQAKIHAKEQEKHAEAMTIKDTEEENPALTREQRIAASSRVAIDSDTLHGSINLKGARFDDLTLAKYKETLGPESPDVVLFSPNGDANAYFAQIGWVSPDGKTKVPGQYTLWQADKKTLTPGNTVTLSWDNGDNVTFILGISLDKNYMFSFSQRIENHSGHEIVVAPYAYINRTYLESGGTPVLHEGPLGVMTGALDQITYKELREKGSKTYTDASGWFGITDRYWLSALIPVGDHHKSTFSYYSKNGKDRYQVDYLDNPITIAAGTSREDKVRLFSGAKEISVLDAYAKGDPAHGQPPIPLFDRAVDFGSLYFLTKPLLILLTTLYSLTGNFGVAILLMTIMIRILLYPLANKSYKATAQMRALQPEIMKIRERHVDDSIALNKETLSLYKREKVNPASGCLPVLLQMPVFFALYKVLYVSIEMRHAPFFGWLRDLSAPDPANFFTLFGAIKWAAPTFLHIGILPALMCLTMVIQMRQQPKPADPVQAKMMNFMPYFFLFVFAKMPAGLVLYWTWSNIISILQQRLISTRHKSRDQRKKKVGVAA